MTRAAIAALPPRLISASNESEPDVPDLAALTSAMARGDDEAWLEFHRTYGAGLFRQLLALTRGDDDLSKEALQRAYLRVAKHVRRCESAAMFHSWLRTVARSALLDCWRRRRSFTDLLFRRRSEPPELPHEESDVLLDELDGALERLDPDDRSLLESKYLSGLGVREIAGRLGVTPKAVESRLHRARAALRSQLLAAIRRNEQ